MFPIRETTDERGTLAGSHVALLRGINVGRAKRLAMADLRALFEDLGYRDVATLLNSGNVVFTVTGKTSTVAAGHIEDAIVGRLGVSVRVTVFTAKELAAVVAKNSLLDVAHDPSRLVVAFLTNPIDRSRLKPLVDQEWAPEVLALGPRVAYLWCPKGIADSTLAAAVGNTLADSVTMRNWATVTKLNALTAVTRA